MTDRYARRPAAFDPPRSLRENAGRFVAPGRCVAQEPAQSFLSLSKGIPVARRVREATGPFYVDGQEMRSWDTGIPQNSMHLMLNTWFPNWLDGRRPKKTTYTYVDSVGYTAQP